MRVFIVFVWRYRIVFFAHTNVTNLQDSEVSLLSNEQLKI